MAEQLKEHIKDPGSAITHFIGMLMAIFAAIPLLLKAAREPSKIYIIFSACERRKSSPSYCCN